MRLIEEDYVGCLMVFFLVGTTGSSLPQNVSSTSMVLRSVGHSADRQEFLYRGRDVDKPTTDLWPLCDDY